ncbi:MAG: hypothetical protein WAL71_02765 [Terriglobales bacterium]
MAWIRFRFPRLNWVCGPLAILLFSVFLSAALAAASAPPLSENAYCGKGNVPRFGDKDGVAELPKTCYYTALDGTPSQGKQIHVAAKENLADAIDKAKCGDTLLLPAGAAYEVKELPAKKCDEGHYITIRTDTPDSKLPPEGSRISPAWAGISSLPGRPAFAQPSGGPARLLATIVAKNPVGVPVGDHVRFIGIEWVSQGFVNRLISAEHADHVIFDRNYIHPAEGDELAHGIGLIEGAHSIAVINSYISGFNCIARSGKCTDANGIGGALSHDPFGTFKIYNNFVEASGENILFGGAPAEYNPTDIEIRRNHLFRPMIWKQGEPGYTPSPKGDPFIVKNNFELKSGVRVLFEANLLENAWGGFSQRGFSILLNARNQSSRCPACRVNDITIRYNRVRNVGGVLQISNAPVTADKGSGMAADGGRYSIHDLVADKIHGDDFKAGGVFLLIGSGGPTLHDVQIDHVTSFEPGVLANILVPADKPKIQNFIITNSVLSAGGRRPPIASAGGGMGSCASRSQGGGPDAVLRECLSPYKLDHNLIITEGMIRGAWPEGNTIVTSENDAGVHDLKNGESDDPRLCPAKGMGCPKKSPGIAAASDGRDIGADVEGVETTVAGVE